MAGFTAFIGTLAVFHALFVTRRVIGGVTSRCSERSASGRDRPGGVIDWQGFFLSAHVVVSVARRASSPGVSCGARSPSNTNVLAVIDVAVVLIVAFGVFVLCSPAFVSRPVPRGPPGDVRREPTCGPSDESGSER